jgi:AAA15 family ATPase/GTPase
LALIYGANASGKTTVLKALDFIRKICTEPFDKKTEKFDFEPFLFDENTPKQNTKFELEFVQNGIRYFYEVELNKNCIVKEKLYNFNPNKALVFERNTDEQKELTSIKFGSKIPKRKTLEDNLEIFTLWNNTVLGGFLKANIESELLKNFLDLLKIDLYPTLSNNVNARLFITSIIANDIINKNHIAKFLKIADFNISTLIIKREKEFIPKSIIDESEFFIRTENGIAVEMNAIENNNVYFNHTVNGKNFTLPIDLESDGTQKYFELSGILGMLILGICIIPIDELESSLHPDLFNHFLLTYLVNGKKESQLIATTHNREILNNRDLFRDDAIWFTDKNEDSATELYSLADFDSSVVRDTTNVLNAYKSGKLGGVPNLGDYYINLDEE